MCQKLILTILFLILSIQMAGAQFLKDPQELLDAMLVETYPQGECGEEAYDAEYQLTAMGAEAFPTLLGNINNPRRSCRISHIMDAYDDSIGAFCHALLVRYLEGESLTAVPETAGLDAVDESHRVFVFLPKQMLVSWLYPRVGMSLRDLQSEAARYAIELSLRDGRICTAEVWRDRLAQLGVTDLPAVDPKQQAQGDFDREVFYFDPGTILDMIFRAEIDSFAAVFPPSSGLARELGMLVIDRNNTRGMIALRNWLDEHKEELQPLRLKTAGPDYDPVATQADFTASMRTDVLFEIQVDGGQDSFGHICWQPFMVVPLRPRSFDSSVLFGIFAEHGSRCLPPNRPHADD